MEFQLALRRILTRPIGSLVVVVAVALSVAVNGALFSVLDGLLFRPLPFQNPDRLVAVDYRQDGQLAELAFRPEFADRRAALREGVGRSPLVAAASQAGFQTFFSRDEARDLGLEVQGVDSQFFPLLGLSPLLGATFSLEDERSPAALSPESRAELPIVIGHDLWRRVYGADPEVLGVHQLAGRTVRIIGVMGPAVKFPGETNVWAPVGSTRARPPALVRLVPGAAIDQLAGVFPELRFKHLKDAVQPGQSRALLVLFGAAVILLVVTWVQVAGLMFSGSLGQLHEIGMRLALGAGRRHLVRQFAMEGALTAGAAFSLAWMGIRPLTAFIVSMLPGDLSHGQYLSPDIRTFQFACAISLLGFSVITVAPLVLVRWSAPLVLLSGGLGEGRFRVERLRNVLTIGQITLTGFLLYLCGLAVHSFVEAVTFDYGFDADHVLVFTPPPWARPNSSSAQLFADFAERNRRVEVSVEVLQRVPGVIAAATFGSAPLGVGMKQELLQITQFDGRPIHAVQARGNAVGVNFIRALGATVIIGQTFDDPEYVGRDDVVVVNETLARRLSPPITVVGDQLAPSVVGREIRSGPLRGRIIGVIKDLVDTAPDLPADPQFFQPYRASGGFGLVIRVGKPVDAALPAIRGALLPVWGQLPARQFSLMRDEINTVVVPYRAQSVLLSLIAGFCLPIATIGLMGALTYSVRVRTREIAIRLAIGADPAMVRRSIVRRALATVCVGIVLGTALGAATASVIGHQLLNVHPADVSTMAAVTAGLMGVGWLAAFVPARAASRIEASVALRQG